MDLPDTSYRQLLDAAPDAVLICDLSGKLRYANEQAVNLFGHPRAALLALSLEQLLPARYRAGHPALRAQFALETDARAMGRSLDLQALHHDGHEFPVEISLAGVPIEGERLTICTIRDVTSRAQLATSLIGILNTSLNEIYIFNASTLRFIQVNDGACNNLGYTMEELKDMTAVDLKPEFDTATFNDMVGPLRRAERDKLVFTTVHQRKNGSHYPVEVHLQITTLQSQLVFVAIILDITERERSEFVLRESEERFREMAHGLPILVWVVNTLGQQTFVNQTFLDYFQVSEEAVLGDGWQLLLHPDEEQFPSRFKDGLNRREPFHAEVQVRDGNGQWRWLESLGRPRFTSSGDFLGYVGTSIDITDRRRAERERLEADQRKDEFLATLAHELRNPLAPIGSGLDIIAMAENADQVREARQTAQRQLHKLTRLIDDLLDVARISRGDIELDLQDVDLSLVVRDALETSGSIISRHGHRLQVELPDPPIHVRGDLVRLEQVMSNLLVNAARYTPDGGQLTIRAAIVEGQATVTVTDDGIGLAAQHLDVIFEKFHQLRGESGTARDGLGIGLWLARTLVDKHRGTLLASSAGPGRGSCFTLTLPLLDPERQAQPAPAAPAATMPGPQRRDIHQVLVVDDNIDAARSLAQVIELMGRRAAIATSGTQALEKVALLDPDLVILDIGLPDMDGRDVARQVREQPGSEGMILVALSGWGQASELERSRESGLHAHFVKPMDFAVLRRLLEGQLPDQGNA